MTEATAPPQDPKPSRAWLLFPGIVVGLLAGHMAICILAMTLAVGGRGYAVVPDYYEKAVRWDQTQAQRRASDALGWSATLDVAAHADAFDQRAVAITLHDRNGHPITDATISATCFHLANPAKQQTLTLAHSGRGVYSVVAPMPSDGLWQMDLNATRGDDVYVDTQVVETGDAAAAANSQAGIRDWGKGNL